MMAYLLLVLVLAGSMIMIGLGLPGLWIMIASAITYNIVVPERPMSTLTMIGIVALGIVAEVLDFTLAGSYARKYGGSRKAAWGAIIGGTIGAIVGVPIPFVGSLVGALVGSFVGAFVGEVRDAGERGPAAKVATGALIGRVLGTVIKVGLGFMVAIWIFFAAMQ
jgi:uncharacterized protein YqgC (DUF456 family)